MAASTAPTLLAPDTLPEGFTVQLWTYKGHVLLQGGKLGVAFEAEDGKERIFAASAFKRGYASPGMTFLIPASDTQALFSRLQWKGRLSGEHEQKVVAWEAEDKALMLSIDAEAKRKKAVLTSEMRAALRPIAKAYACTNHQGKLALQVLVLDYIQRGLATDRPGSDEWGGD